MANYPQLDDQVGVWKLKDVNDAVMGGYWRLADPKGSRAITQGGGSPSNTASMDFVNIASTGDAAVFGDLTAGRSSSTSFSSFTRGVFSGGTDPSNVDIQEYVTIATLGNAADFGNLTDAVNLPGGCSNTTRGLVAGGRDPGMSNIMSYQSDMIRQ